MSLPSWLHFSAVSGSGDTIITITADTYTGLTDREIDLIISGITKSVTVPVLQYNQYVAEYLTFDIKSNGYIYLSRPFTNVSVSAVTISYSINGGDWVEYTTDEYKKRINVSAGDVIRFKGLNSRYAYSQGDYTRFNCFGGTATFDVHGNIMSMIYGDDFEDKKTLSEAYALTGLFYKAPIGNAENLVLPATALTDYCYMRLFDSSSVTNPPKVLPNATLAERCYGSMFSQCTGLTTSTTVMYATTMAPYCCHRMYEMCTNLSIPPTLPATTLAEGCYSGMFEECTSFTTPPVLPATTMALGCYSEMFWACSGLTSTPTLTSTTLAQGCYSNMFGYCSSLTTTPVLPATTLAPYCYGGMFSECSGLTTTHNLPAVTLAEGCYSAMFLDCISLTTPPAISATTLADYACDSMFMGCTSLTTAPELPVATLVNNCYANMFRNCINLNYIKCLATDISASGCTRDWVRNVAQSGTFVKDSTMNNWTIGYSGIPVNWIVQDYNTPAV